MLEYAYGLPAVRERRAMDKDQYTLAKERGTAWCQCIVDKANDWDLDHLIGLLTMGMLKIDTEERLSAGQCLEPGAQ